VARLWGVDGAPGPSLNTGTVHSALQLADGRLLTWSGSNTPQLWPLERSLVAWADEYIERLYSLFPLQACSYYLEPDEMCAALRAAR
jgi:hypothetical protein